MYIYISTYIQYVEMGSIQIYPTIPKYSRDSSLKNASIHFPKKTRQGDGSTPMLGFRKGRLEEPPGKDEREWMNKLWEYLAIVGQ